MFALVKTFLFLAQVCASLQLASAQRLRPVDTLEVSVFSASQGGCDGQQGFQTPQQIFTIGSDNLNPCFITAKPFLTVTTSSVAQSLLARNLRVMAFEATGCSGKPVFQTKLSNGDDNCCDATPADRDCFCEVSGRCSGQPMRSFRLAPAAL